LRCFQPYQIRFPFRFRFGFCFRRPLEGLCLSALHHFRRFPLRLIIGPLDLNSGMPEAEPFREIDLGGGWLLPGALERRARLLQLARR
ncbi:hypothetical protein, partial [Streptomyces sp. NPDC051310]|uniref:hypothetical protein n=1 Tax=Streptomyces sp. NPDC051310 TaxID=3365649 RepID=UPI003798DA3D